MKPCKFIREYVDNPDFSVAEIGTFIGFFQYDLEAKAVVLDRNGIGVVVKTHLLQITGNSVEDTFNLVLSEIEKGLDNYVPKSKQTEFMRDLQTIINNNK